MKTNAFIFFLFLINLSISLKAQDYTKLDQIKLNAKTDYQKSESLVLECSKYILNSNLELLEKDLNHTQALLFIMKWMEGTADYKFSIDETISNATKSNASLLGVYLAATSKYVLENKDKAGDEKEVKFNSIVIFLNYCEDPGKNVKLKGELKKMIKAKNENTLREYLKM